MGVLFCTLPRIPRIAILLKSMKIQGCLISRQTHRDIPPSPSASAKYCWVKPPMTSLAGNCPEDLMDRAMIRGWDIHVYTCLLMFHNFSSLLLDISAHSHYFSMITRSMCETLPTSPWSINSEWPEPRPSTSRIRIVNIALSCLSSICGLTWQSPNRFNGGLAEAQTDKDAANCSYRPELKQPRACPGVMQPEKKTASRILHKGQ
jgi:hypothetical protein